MPGRPQFLQAPYTGTARGDRPNSRACFGSVGELGLDRSARFRLVWLFRAGQGDLGRPSRATAPDVCFFFFNALLKIGLVTQACREGQRLSTWFPPHLRFFFLFCGCPGSSTWRERMTEVRRAVTPFSGYTCACAASTKSVFVAA